jgi:hypothetical protein
VLGGVDQDVLAVGIDPHLGYLRGTVRHEGGELAVGGLSQQLLEAGGYGFGHGFSPRGSGVETKDYRRASAAAHHVRAGPLRRILLPRTRVNKVVHAPGFPPLSTNIILLSDATISTISYPTVAV